jgi:hypothetical protein
VDTPIYAYLIVDNKADTLTESQMLQAPDHDNFIASQPKEIGGLLKMDVFNLQHISIKPKDAKLLSSIWRYRHKRNPEGEFLKHKSCICIDGSQQQHGRDFWKVHAPVVSWPTIHLMLLLSSILDLKQW